MELDLEKIPLSRNGSFFTLRAEPGGALMLRDLHGGDEAPAELFRLELLAQNGGPAAKTHVRAGPTSLELEGGGRLRLCFGAPESICIRAENAALRFVACGPSRYDTPVPLGNGDFEYISYKKDRRYLLRAQNADLRLSETAEHAAVFTASPRGGPYEVQLVSYRVVWNGAPPPDYARAQAAVDGEYAAWLRRMALPGGEVGERAAYLLWSCVAGPEGGLSRPAIYSSKHSMANAWSWDNCFCALAVAQSAPELALDQLLLFADRQDASGAYPDFINDRFSSFSCVKPPVFGWTCGRLLRLNPYFREPAVLKPLYETVCRNTEFWMNHRRADGLFCYTNGNDSGWDNASCFAGGVPLASPDLFAHLVRQADALAEMAGRLDMPRRAAEWRERAAAWAGLLLARLHDGEGFFARRPGCTPEPRGSLLLRLPVLAAKRLPPNVADALFDDLSRRFQTPFGFATEAPDSPFYRKNGYWLGPVWAPVMYLLTDAMEDAGRKAWARKEKRLFLRAVEIGGMAENFDPETGRGNCDPAFAWTAAVCALYLRELDGTGE